MERERIVTVVKEPVHAKGLWSNVGMESTSQRTLLLDASQIGTSIQFSDLCCSLTMEEIRT